MNAYDEQEYLQENEIDELDDLTMEEVYAVHTMACDGFHIAFIKDLERYIGERVMYAMFLQRDGA